MLSYRFPSGIPPTYRLLHKLCHDVGSSSYSANSGEQAFGLDASRTADLCWSP